MPQIRLLRNTIVYGVVAEEGSIRTVAESLANLLVLAGKAALVETEETETEETETEKPEHGKQSKKK